MRALPRTTTLGLCLAIAGCATFRSPQAKVQDVHPQQQERKHEAVEDYERRRNEAELHAARVRAEQGDLSGCAAAVESVLRRDPTSRDARLLMADVHLARENTAAAEKLLRTLVQEDANDPHAQHALALLLESTGRAGDAQPLFQSAAALMPEEPLYALSQPASTSARSNAAAQPASFDRTANSDSNGGSPLADANLAMQRKALQAIPKSAEGRQRLAQSLAMLDAGDDAGAASAILKAMDAEPRNRQLPLAYSVQALRLGHPLSAITVLEAASRRFPAAPEILRALGAAHLDGGNPQAAQVVLQQALSLDNADPLSYFLLGQVLRQQGQPREAEEALAQAHRLDRRYPQR